MNISPHFTLDELTRSDTAARLDIDNEPTDNIIRTLTHLAQQLEQVRHLVGPMYISSGYRCLALNRVLNSKDSSQHLKGQAVDFTVRGKSPLEVCKLIEASEVKFDQLILEYERWTHISFVWESPPRGDVLTIDRNGTRLGLTEA